MGLMWQAKSSETPLNLKGNCNLGRNQGNQKINKTSKLLHEKLRKTLRNAQGAMIDKNDTKREEGAQRPKGI